MAVKEERLTKQAETVEKSAVQLERSATAVEQSADRNTVLAADRTILAAERTYAAWVRTGLAALASGVGAKALLGGIVSGLWGSVIATVLILFSAFCLIAAIWRQLNPGPPPPPPDLPRIPTALLIMVNGFLVLVALAVLIGIWAFKAS
jgi:putative membrane protein